MLRISRLRRTILGGAAFAFFLAFCGLAGCGLTVVGDGAASSSSGTSSGASLPPNGDPTTPNDGGLDTGTDGAVGCEKDCAGGECVAGKCSPATLLALDAHVVRAVAVHGDKLYFADETAQTVVQANKDGSGRTDLLTGAIVRHFAVTGDELWYTVAELSKKPFGGTSIALLSGAATGCVTFDPAATRGYAVDPAGSRVVSAGTSGGYAVTELTTGEGLASPLGLAVTANDFFFTASSGKIMRRPRIAPVGTLPTEVLSDQSSPGCLTIGPDGLLYWPTTGNGAIHRSKLDGTDEEILATGQTNPTQVAIDDRFLYWNSGSKVMRLVR